MNEPKGEFVMRVHRARTFGDLAVFVLTLLTIGNAIFTIWFSPSRRNK